MRKEKNAEGERKPSVKKQITEILKKRTAKRAEEKYKCSLTRYSPRARIRGRRNSKGNTFGYEFLTKKDKRKRIENERSKIL